ncbi:MAG: aromatic amino acid lyase [Gammaproteobacteria bacterium]|nr:aromatic amino acid lyase [Gammaproteobacteria bacterium]
MTTITLKAITDINWQNVQAIAYEHAGVKLNRAALTAVQHGRERFLRALAAGLPCYGVSTGLGKFVERQVTDLDDREFVVSTLRARAAACGPPLPRAVSRSTMVLKLTNFLSGMDGVRPALCEYIVARLNDGLTPWIPTYGHGMAADATANSHVFQTLTGEGFVWGEDGTRCSAREVLRHFGADAYVPDRKEALALINGIAATPAYAIDAHRRLSALLASANCIAALSMLSAAVPLDSIDTAVGEVSAAHGVAEVLAHLRRVVSGQDYRPHTLQAPVSFRVVPQVHGAFADALHDLRNRVENCFSSFSDNPMLAENRDGESRFLSVGVFHNQHLANQIDHVAVATAHVAVLSERRLHRLLDAQVTGLTPQLAEQPGLHAGLVVAHKASLDLIARLKVLAQPVSLHTGESSGGQEDYMSMAIPAIHRLYQMACLTQHTLAYEFLAILVALDQRPPRADSPAAKLYASGRRIVQKTPGDRAPGPDVEALFELLEGEDWQSLCRRER